MMPLARRALVALTLVAGVLALTAMFLSYRRSEEHEHTMKCLAAYMAFIQVIGGPEEESVDRLKTARSRRMARSPFTWDRENILLS
jgi:hypothetical protein